MTKQTSRIIGIAAAMVVLAGAAAFASPEKEDRTERGEADAGVLVVRVEPESPADKAGIARGDIILALDGEEVATVADVRSAIVAKEPGDKVKVTLRHGDARRTVTAELGELRGRAYLGLYFEPTSEPAVQPPVPSEGQPAPERGPAPGEQPEGEGQPAPGPRSLPRILARSGAEIVRVIAGSPAEKAGLERGDVITAVDGTLLEQGDDLSSIIAEHKPGEKLALELLGSRDESREVTVTLARSPEDASKAWLGIEYRMAFRIEGRTPWATRPQLLRGVRVTGVTRGGPAGQADIARGDLLTSIDGQPVRTASDVADALAEFEPGDTVKVGVVRYPDEGETIVEVTLGDDPDARGKAWLGVQLGRPWLVPDWPEWPNRGGSIQQGPGGGASGGAAPGGMDA